jgi:hypothetical protein
MSAPIGYYVTCDEAECASCHCPENWPGFEGWEAPLPIFYGTEADTPTHCTACGDLIPHALTPDGYVYVREAVTRLRGDRTVLASWNDVYLDGRGAGCGGALDPETTLRELRDLVAVVDRGGAGWTARTFAHHFERLDAWLSDQGEPPEDWVQCWPCKDYCEQYFHAEHRRRGEGTMKVVKVDYGGGQLPESYDDVLLYEHANRDDRLTMNEGCHYDYLRQRWVKGHDHAHFETGADGPLVFCGVDQNSCAGGYATEACGTTGMDPEDFDESVHSASWPWQDDRTDRGGNR